MKICDCVSELSKFLTECKVLASKKSPLPLSFFIDDFELGDLDTELVQTFRLRIVMLFLFIAARSVEL